MNINHILFLLKLLFAIFFYCLCFPQQNQCFASEQAFKERTSENAERDSLDGQVFEVCKSLRSFGTELYDGIVSFETVSSLDGIKESLKPYVSRGLLGGLDDAQILSELQYLLKNVSDLNLRPSDDIMNYQVGLEKQRKETLVIDFRKKWESIEQSQAFNHDFYESLYHALSKNEVLDAAEYPDPSDAQLNSLKRELARKNRRSRLIIFLASIKKTANAHTLAQGIEADSREGVPFSTNGNAQSWFYDKRYKLYKIAEKLPDLSDGDKATLLSNFLHAGKHCNVAKRWQIDDSFKLFAPEAARALEEEIFPKDASLEKKIEHCLASEKHNILANKIQNALAREKHNISLHGEAEYSIVELDRESVTYMEATWDAYAHNFGLPERQCPYMSYQLSISEEEALGHGGGYTAKRIYDTVLRVLGDELNQYLMGNLKFLVKDPERIIIAYLRKNGFISENGVAVSNQWYAKSSTSRQGGHSSATTVTRSSPTRGATYRQNHEPPRRRQWHNVDWFRGHNSSHVRRHSSRARNDFGVCVNGRVPQPVLSELRNEAQRAFSQLNLYHYEELIMNPELASNDADRLLWIAARELFILVDRSGSMNAEDRSPIGLSNHSWTRWDSAAVASGSIVEIVLSLDPNQIGHLMLWDEDRFGRLNTSWENVTNLEQVQDLFRFNPPARGSTPLANALNEAYQLYWGAMLQRAEPFTAVVLIDGAPNDYDAVKQFFRMMIQENGLMAPGRQFLASFSFVQIGNDHGAVSFLRDLKDDLTWELGYRVDPINIWEDDFLFGTGRYQGRQGVGPFGMLWNTLPEGSR